MPTPLISGCCYCSMELLHPWGQSLISNHLQELNYDPPWKILTIARAACTLIRPAHWGQSILTNIIEIPSLEGPQSHWNCSGSWRSSRLGETFPLEFLKHSLLLLKTERVVMQNSCIGTSWAGRSSMLMQTFSELITEMSCHPGIQKSI